MRHRAAATWIVGGFVALSGCSPGMIQPSDVGALGVMVFPTRTAWSANRVVRADLASLQGTSLDAALSQLRPQWLRVNASSRQVAEPVYASVYVDNVYTGDIGILRFVPVSTVIEVSFLGSSAARDRFGSGCQCTAGAIVVVTRNSR
jgi:hypothetical protein